MLIIPTVVAPSQTLFTVLTSQACRINLYQKPLGLFLDLHVNDALRLGGALCLNGTLIVRDAYLGFIGDLIFFDLQGQADPIYSGLGSRWWFYYVEPFDVIRG